VTPVNEMAKKPFKISFLQEVKARGILGIAGTELNN
jgi:hypothetical protein